MFRSEQGVIPGSEPQNYDDILRKQKVFSQCGLIYLKGRVCVWVKKKTQQRERCRRRSEGRLCSEFIQAFENKQFTAPSVWNTHTAHCTELGCLRK